MNKPKYNPKSTYHVSDYGVVILFIMQEKLTGGGLEHNLVFDTTKMRKELSKVKEKNHWERILWNALNNKEWCERMSKRREKNERKR